MQNFAGQQIDRYRIIERLGMGGMAVVYKAYDTRLERDVAIKIIRTEAIPQEQHERLLKRFEREAKAQARFSHPNIISVHDYGEVADSPYLVMEFIQGGTLKERLQGPVDWRQAIEWLVPIADALGYAHERHTIHRDVKPSNILFGENDRPLLTDFGIAKLLETDEATLTGTGLGVGTPEYMAPEQWQGKATQATDQYALGVVLYELLTGHKPYTAETPVAVALMQMSEPLRSPRALAPSMPEALEKLLYKALARDPQDRYEDMHALRHALENISAGEPIVLTPQPDLKAQPVFEPKPEPKPLRQPVYVHSFDSEGETRDMLDTGTGVRALHAPGKAEKKHSQPNWLLWGGVGVVVLIGLTVGMVLLIGNLVTGLASREGTGSEVISNADTSIDNMAIATEVPATQSLLPSPSPTEAQAPTPTATFEPTLGIGSTMVNPVDGAMMVYVPEGEFTMGSEESDADDDEKPEHIVYLDAYWIYQTEVTNRQFADFINASGYQTTAEQAGWSYVWDGSSWKGATGAYWGSPEGPDSSVAGREDHPVVHMSWYDADAYCQWAGGRLPTEAEWEKAARGADGRVYPWGNAPPTCRLANFYGCVSRTTTVGSYPDGTSSYGALDMAGNVWEWVADWYDGNYYSRSPDENPPGPTDGDYRVLRGGSWVSDGRFLRVSDRSRYFPVSMSNDYGFRCFRSP